MSPYHHILMSLYHHILSSNYPSIGDHLRLNSQTSTKIGLDQLDSLCCMMEELSLLREQNSRLQKQLNFMEVLSSLSYHPHYVSSSCAKGEHEDAGSFWFDGLHEDGWFWFQ